MKTFLLVALSLLITFSAMAQKPVLKATRVSTPPKIDGNFDDDAWKNSPSVDLTITYMPTFGNAPSEKSDIHVVYDDVAIYIGAYLHDSHPNQIAHELCERDGSAITDDFIVGFDTYDDHLNGYRFIVTAAGVQIDQRITQISNNDRTWDAVWQSAASIKSDGWVVEMKIPYSAIRFPSKSPQNWGMNFGRDIIRLGELDLWSPVDPKVTGIINQWGTLEDLENIEPPLRLSLSPYFTAGVQMTPISDNPPQYQTDKILGGGADIKWGINESFTLDATLIPDFGQVQSDNLVLNISPFETKFNEKRPFFTEGVELFNQDNTNNGNNSPQVFYSRRIGGLPYNYYSVQDSVNDNETMISNPTTSKLYNATKLSGRTNGGFGIGFLNSVTQPTFAQIKNNETGDVRRIETNPLTNYNVIVFDQTLPHNSKLSFENTNVWRDGALPDANVSSLHYDLRDKANYFQVTGFGNFSAIFDPTTESNPTEGGYYQINLNKIKGRWQEWFWHELITPNYNQNDLGILYYSNQMTNGAGFSYNNQEIKKGIFTNASFWVNLNYKTQVKPLQYEEWETSDGWNVVLKNFYSFGGNLYGKPFWYYDYYEPRVAGRKYYHYPFGYGNIWMNTDYRKKINAFVFFGFGEAPGPHNPFYETEVQLNWIVNDHFSVSPDIYLSKDFGTKSFVDFDADGNSIFGARNTSTVSNAITIKYAFNPKMNINFRARYYWSKVNWLEYYLLHDDGTLGPTDFTGNYDINFNVFNIDAVYA
ncbi:MAG: DUF5916 domain-containing protein, partial [Chitinophagales bacterium]